MSKDYAHWMQRKQAIEQQSRRAVFRERQVWWCCLGENIGYETDGKNEFFTRPVLIIRKFNQFSFYGVPLTSQEKPSPFYIPIEVNQKTSYVMISQMRLFDAKRLRSRMTEIPKASFETICQAIRGLIP